MNWFLCLWRDSPVMWQPQVYLRCLQEWVWELTACRGSVFSMSAHRPVNWKPRQNERVEKMKSCTLSFGVRVSISPAPGCQSFKFCVRSWKSPQQDPSPASRLSHFDFSLRLTTTPVPRAFNWTESYYPFCQEVLSFKAFVFWDTPMAALILQ